MSHAVSVAQAPSRTLPRWTVPDVRTSASPDMNDVAASGELSSVPPAATAHTLQPETVMSAAAPSSSLADLRRSLASRCTACRDGAVELVSSAGEWMGINGPGSNWLTRLTCAAVALVLVSGLSLLLATSEKPTGDDDVATEAVRTSEKSVASPQADLGDEAVQHVGASDGAGGSVESAVYQTSGEQRLSAPDSHSAHRRGVWLEGRIELE